jgi:hypothetical protein
MEQPPGFEDSLHPDWVCKVNQSLYGLKQLPRQWNIELDKALCNLGLSCSRYDPTLYFKVVNGKLIGALTAQVNDLAIVGKPLFVDQLIQDLGNQFKIGAAKDLHHFLSIRITRDPSAPYVYMDQAHYIDEMCSCFLQGNHTNVPTPTDLLFKSLHRWAPGEAPSSGPYNQLIGSMLWVLHKAQRLLRYKLTISASTQSLRQSLVRRSQGFELSGLYQGSLPLPWWTTHMLRLLRL